MRGEADSLIPSEAVCYRMSLPVTKCKGIVFIKKNKNTHDLEQQHRSAGTEPQQ